MDRVVVTQATLREELAFHSEPPQCPIPYTCPSMRTCVSRCECVFDYVFPEQVVTSAAQNQAGLSIQLPCNQSLVRIPSQAFALMHRSIQQSYFILPPT